MKKAFRFLMKLVGFLLCIVIIVLAGSTVYHHAMLDLEADKIAPPDTLVEVNGHRLHVYAEGEKSASPTFVFMAGAATIAPMYDFKSLYAKLSPTDRIVVIERLGYGYSDIADSLRDVDTVLTETREALELAGERAPYILVPHSMAGIEALYWAQKFPQEIQGIIGLDMAVPESYMALDSAQMKWQSRIGQAASWLGVHRLLGALYPLSTEALTEAEKEQQRLLLYRNALNAAYGAEGEAIRGNASRVSSQSLPSIPILQFVSDGEGLTENWIYHQERFAQAAKSQLFYLTCGHYVHHTESALIAQKAKEFADGLTPERKR